MDASSIVDILFSLRKTVLNMIKAFLSNILKAIENLQRRHSILREFVVIPDYLTVGSPSTTSYSYSQIRELIIAGSRSSAFTSAISMPSTPQKVETVVNTERVLIPYNSGKGIILAARTSEDYEVTTSRGSYTMTICEILWKMEDCSVSLIRPPQEKVYSEAAHMYTLATGYTSYDSTPRELLYGYRTSGSSLSYQSFLMPSATYVDDWSGSRSGLVASDIYSFRGTIPEWVDAIVSSIWDPSHSPRKASSWSVSVDKEFFARYLLAVLTEGEKI